MTPGLTIPRRVWLLAIAASLFHIFPYTRALYSTAPGWTFAGNTSISVDWMQYRVWMRQTLVEGPIVTDAFTTEPNRPHLLVVHYWALGQAARALHVSPEFAYAVAGCLYALALALLLYAIVRHFIPDARDSWWTLLALMVGGGLGAHLKIVAELPGLKGSFLVSRLISEPLNEFPVFEDYRNHYIVKTLFDTHHLLIWIVSLLAVMAFYRAIQGLSRGWALATAAAVAAGTLLHLYEGVTLLAIFTGVAVTEWAGTRRLSRPLVVAWLASVAAAGITLGWLAWLVAHSGLDVPPWRAINILFLILLLAFPLQWVLMAWKGREYWRDASPDQRFLVGWALGCTALTLSGPFYPYPDRGTMTMQVPVTIIAAQIVIRWWPRPSRRAVLAGAALLLATPVWLIARTIKFTAFREDAPWMFLSAAHREQLDALKAVSHRNDVLLAGSDDLLWLAPDFPGRLYLGHFFLTPSYEQKRAAFERWKERPGVDTAFLRRTGARFVFIGTPDDTTHFVAPPELQTIRQNAAGTLYEVAGQASPPVP